MTHGPTVSWNRGKSLRMIFLLLVCGCYVMIVTAAREETPVRRSLAPASGPSTLFPIVTDSFDGSYP
jgi:hypothetical protein